MPRRKSIKPTDDPWNNLQFLVEKMATPLTLPLCEGLFGELRKAHIVFKEDERAELLEGLLTRNPGGRNPSKHVLAARDLIYLTDLPEGEVQRLTRASNGEQPPIENMATRRILAGKRFGVGPLSKEREKASLQELLISFRKCVKEEAQRRQVAMGGKAINSPSTGEGVPDVDVLLVNDATAVTSVNRVADRSITREPRFEKPNDSEREATPPLDPIRPRRSWPSPNIDPTLRQALQRVANTVMRRLEQDLRDTKTRPVPMPVSWKTAAPHLSDHPQLVHGTRHAVKPELVDGMIDDVVETFTSIPSHRMVVLGRGGSGKSILAEVLAVGLIKSQWAEDHGQVPVVFKVHTWNPGQQEFVSWLKSELISGPQAVLSSAPADVESAAQLVDEHHILPILDGFDELPTSMQGEALRKLNSSSYVDNALVLTSRPDEY